MLLAGSHKQTHDSDFHGAGQGTRVRQPHARDNIHVATYFGGEVVCRVFVRDALPIFVPFLFSSWEKVTGYHIV